MKEYEIVMGLEVHVELATNSKLFCSCSAKFGADANEHVCPACAGMPGMLPITNKKPMFLRWFFLELEKRKPKSINGIARIEISALKPKKATIQAVMVVPMLAPMITPIACTNVRSPAFTKLTTITVVAEED